MDSEVKGSKLLVDIPGDLTAEAVESYSLDTADIFEYVDPNVTHVCFNVSRVKTMDSMGLTYLVGLCRMAKINKWNFEISGASKNLYQQFAFNNLVQHFGIQVNYT